MRCYVLWRPETTRIRDGTWCCITSASVVRMSESSIWAQEGRTPVLRFTEQVQFIRRVIMVRPTPHIGSLKSHFWRHIDNLRHGEGLDGFKHKKVGAPSATFS